MQPRGTEGDHKIFTFQERATWHPLLLDKTNVFSVYFVSHDIQSPYMFGTYRVEDGVIVQTPVWMTDDEFNPPRPEYRNDVITLVPGVAMSIEGGDGRPSHYDAVEVCIIPVGEDGYRRNAMCSREGGDRQWSRDLERWSDQLLGHLHAMVEIDARPLLTATPTNVGTTYLGCDSTGDSDASDPTRCNVDAVPPMGDPPMQIPVVANAMFP